MRTLSAEMTAAIGADLVAPVYLLELDCAPSRRFTLNGFGDDFNLTTGPEWLGTSMQVLSLTQKSGAGMEARVRVAHDARYASFSPIGLLETLLEEPQRYVPASLSVTYFTHNTYTDAKLLLSGVMSSFTLVPGATSQPMVEVVLVSRANRRTQTPHVRLAPPLLNAMTPEGTVIEWAGEQYEVTP